MLCVQLLGQVRAVRDGETVTRFRTRKAEALLAYLAHFRAHPHPREELLDLLWPDSPPEAARNSLSVALSSLRSQLEVPGSPVGALFRADRHTVAVVAEHVTTDVAGFEAALKRADRAQPASAAESLALADAVRLYTGSFLTAHPDAWVMPEQQRLAEAFARAVQRLAELLRAGGQAAQAVELARGALAVEPLLERLHAELMRSLSAVGESAAALRHFASLAALERDGGLLLDGPLGALAAELRAQPPAAPPVSMAAAEPPAGFAAGVYPLLSVDGSGDAAALVEAVELGGGRQLLALPQGGVFAFARAGAALKCAVALQAATAPGAVRVALHLAELSESGGVPDEAERLLLAAHPGQVVCSEPAAALLRRDLAPGIWLKDLGLYRLEGQSAAERIYQVESPALSERQFPPLRAAAGHDHRLPLPLTRFFGREAEVSAIEELLLGGEARLVTVLGPGGTGKTRLCLETARRLVDPLQGAVWFVPLADVHEGGRIASAIRVALQQPELPGADPLEQLAEQFRRRPALLVLDNFEQLAETGADVVAELLQRAPGLTCLVSSRRSLGVASEREHRLAPLPTPEPPYTVERLDGCESVRLFVDRARAVRPGFHLGPANAADVAELCVRLEGLPLALELAASRVTVLSLPQMLGRLGEALDLLATRQRSVPERHRTLRAAIAWSFDLLPPELQRFFAELSVFRGGFTTEAVERVAEDPFALDRLAALTECSLLVADDGEAVRFRMLDTIRTFGAERLGAAAAVRQRHFACYLAFAAEGQAALERGEETPWLDRLEVERENFRAAFDWALEHQPEGALRLAGALWRYWLVRGHWAEAEQLLEQALERNEAAPPDLRARALGWTGHVAYRRGHYDRAAELLTESLALCRELGDRAGAGNALNELGKVAWALGGHAEARAWYEQSLAIREELGNAWSIAATLSNLGVAAWTLGDHEAAYARFEQALALRRELGDRRGTAGTLRNLGSLAHAQSDYPTARRYHEESLAIWLEMDDRAGVAQCKSELGLVAHSEGDFERAWRQHSESLSVRQQIGDERGIAASLVNLGAVAMERGDYAQAEELYRESHSLSSGIGDRPGVALALNNLGDVATVLGRPAEAKRCYQAGLALQRELGDQGQIAILLNNLGEAALASGEPAEAEDWFRQCHTAADSAGNRWLNAFAHAGLGHVALALGGLAAARRQLEESLALREAIGDAAGVAASLRSLAALMHAEGSPCEAVTLLAAAATERERRQIALRPDGQQQHEALRAELTALLGPADFAECWAHGRDLPVASAVRLAVGRAVPA